MPATWYHGSPLQLEVLRAGSTITQDRHLAEVFSHKPSIVSLLDDGTVQHNGTEAGWLYAVAEEVRPEDVYPHPRSAMPPGKEWLTRRDLRLAPLGPVQIVAEEFLTEAEMAALYGRFRGDEEEG